MIASRTALHTLALGFALNATRCAPEEADPCTLPHPAYRTITDHTDQRSSPSYPHAVSGDGTWVCYASNNGTGPTALRNFNYALLPYRHRDFDPAGRRPFHRPRGLQPQP